MLFHLAANWEQMNSMRIILLSNYHGGMLMSNISPPSLTRLPHLCSLLVCHPLGVEGQELVHPKRLPLIQKRNVLVHPWGWHTGMGFDLINEMHCFTGMKKANKCCILSFLGGFLLLLTHMLGWSGVEAWVAGGRGDQAFYGLENKQTKKVQVCWWIKEYLKSSSLCEEFH